jgi:hypothetical protein
VTTKPTNFDALLLEEFPEAYVPKAERTQTIELFGEHFEVKLGVNVVGIMNAMNADDTSASARLLTNMIADKDQRRFTHAMETAPALADDDQEKAAKLLFRIVNLIIEVASGGNPTSSSSASPTGTRKRAAVKRSVAT